MRIVICAIICAFMSLSGVHPTRAAEVDLYCMNSAGGFTAASPSNPCPVTGGTGGTSSTFGTTFPTTGSPIGVKDSTGTVLTFLKADASNNLDINCTVGCSGGTLNNNADAVATSSANGQSGAWLYAFNGTTWDRLRDDASKNLMVNVNVALPAGSATIGAVNQAGSWAVTANAGTNLNTSALALETGGNLATIGASIIAQEATTSGVKGAEAFGCVTTAKPSYTTAKSDCLSLDANGLLRASLADTPSNTNNLNVNLAASGITLTVSATNLSSNLAQVNGVTTLTGSGAVGTGAARVAVGQDTATIAGSAPGTAGTPSANVLSVQGTASMTAVITQGTVASGVAVSGNVNTSGGRAQNAEATPVANGQAVAQAYDLAGKTIVMPYANKENFITGTTAAITTATNTSVIAAQAAGIKTYMTAFSCSNTGSATSSIDFTSGTGGTEMWNTIVPAGGGTNMTLPSPVPTAAATALYVTTGSASSTIKCSVAGYIGT